MSALKNKIILCIKAVSSETVMTDDQRGIACLIFGMFLFSVQDIFIKAMADQASLIQIITLRGVIGGIVLLGYLRLTGRSMNVGSAYPVLSVIRAILFFTGYLGFYVALSAMPLAEATSIFFVSPFSSPSFHGWC